MALINKLDNAASIVYAGNTVTSNTVETLLDLVPTLVKVVDKLTASIGDTITYTITLTNVGLTSITNIPFTDVLPAGCTYIADSFTVGGTPATPTLTANTLTYTIPSVSALGIVPIVFKATVVGGSI